jgi:HEAT repeat protein
MLWKNPMRFVLTLVLLNVVAPSFAQEAKLLAVLRSDATLEEKSDACRQLTRVATKESIPTLASLLSDEKLSHMARYALEPIRDPAVDDCLCAALGKVQGRPRLGVIGSLGARRATKAVDALAPLLKDADAATAQAAARALGNIGTYQAAQLLEGAIGLLPGSDRQIVGKDATAACEGLLRCAEALAAKGQAEESQAIYRHLRAMGHWAPPQVRAAALRGEILALGKAGIPLMIEAIRGSDRALAAAAVRAAQELLATEITDALAAELPNAPAERRGLLILALADRGDPRILPAIIQAAQGGDELLRILAIRALKRMGDSSCVPTLFQAALEGSTDVSQAAMEALEIRQDKSVDDQIAARLPRAEGKARLLLFELAKQRHTSAAAPALWLAADDNDSAVRVVALAGLGAVLETADLSKLIARLAVTKGKAETAALDAALREVCLRSADREAVAAELAAALPTASGPLKAKLLNLLSNVGGTKALEVVATAARSGDAELRDAAFRVLGEWPSVDAAPLLLELHNTISDDRLKIRAIRAYIRIVRQFDLPADRRAEMCRTALEAAQHDEDKRLVLEVLLRYPSEQMQAIAQEATKIPALKDEASMISMAMAQTKGADRAELGKALAQASHASVKLEILQAEYGAGSQTKDVTAILRRYAKNYRLIFLPNTSYNKCFGGDPARGKVKQLKIKYRLDGKDAEVSLNENAPVVLPMPK